MATSTPVASFGKDPKITATVREKLLPDFDVVHISLDLPAALAELPALCSGDLSVSPSSGLGTHALDSSAPRRVPSIILFGASFSEGELEQVRAAVAARNPAVRFVHVSKLDVLAAGALGPNPETIAQVYRRKIAALETEDAQAGGENGA